MAPENSKKIDIQELKELCTKSVRLALESSVYTSVTAVNGMDYSQDIAVVDSSNDQPLQNSHASLKVNPDTTCVSSSNPAEPAYTPDTEQDVRCIGDWIQQGVLDKESGVEEEAEQSTATRK